MMKHHMHKYIIWLSCLWLLNSACAQASVATPTTLPSATPLQPTTVAVIETTAPIATLTPSVIPDVSPTSVVDTVDTLASQTTEGYYQIGSPTAPVTMVDYSDFF
jgi:protein-disulfide isomerase